MPRKRHRKAVKPQTTKGKMLFIQPNTEIIFSPSITNESAMFAHQAYEVPISTYVNQYHYSEIYDHNPVFESEIYPLISTNLPGLYTSALTNMIPVLVPDIITCFNTCPYFSSFTGMDPLMSPVLPSIETVQIVCKCDLEASYRLVNDSYIDTPCILFENTEIMPPQCVIQEVNTASEKYAIEWPQTEEIITETSDKNQIPKLSTAEAIEFYLCLPKDIFPSPKMIKIDPNPIIDQFCKMINTKSNTSWVLDLEFGGPRVPVSRPIAIYDLKSNSIQCKNTIDTIHPGFQNCDLDFKREILLYYNCIFSNWHEGYKSINQDESMENFQKWLAVPMQRLGMLWR